MVVEDEMIIAIDLSEAIESAGGKVIGPAPSVADALRLLAEGQVDAAILDRTLLDGKATPVAAFMIEQAIPFIFYSGSDPDRLHEDFPRISTFRKPTDPEHLVEALAELIPARST